jgi:hypothetical protein
VIAEVQTNRKLLLFKNFVPKYLHSANLLHRRSPFLCLEHVEHRELIASRWRPAFSSHLVNALIGEVRTSHVTRSMRTTDVPRGRSIFPSHRKNRVKSAFAPGEFANENSAKVGWSRFSRRHILPVNARMG